MRSIFIFTTDETSRNALASIYTGKAQSVIEALKLPAKTTVEFDKKSAGYTFRLSSGESVWMGPYIVRDGNNVLPGIMISLKQLKPLSVLGTEEEIVSRVNRCIAALVRPYAATVQLHSTLLDETTLNRTADAKPGAGRHFMAWVMSLLILPVVTAIMLVWYHLVALFLSWFSNALPGIYKVFDFIDEVIGDNTDTGILGLLATFFVIGIIGLIVKCSEKLCASRKGTRYLITGILGIVLAVGLLVGYIFFRDKVQAILPLNWVAVLLTLYGLGVASFMLIRESRENRQ